MESVWVVSRQTCESGQWHTQLESACSTEEQAMRLVNKLTELYKCDTFFFDCQEVGFDVK